jgi:hypothetical protein
MALNNTKCGVMFMAGQSMLSISEIRQKAIAGVPVVAACKYLGVHLQKK